jgi:hypothetical protein
LPNFILSGTEARFLCGSDGFFQSFEQFFRNTPFVGSNHAFIPSERLQGGSMVGVNGLHKREIKVGVREIRIDLRREFEVKLRQPEIVLIEVKIGEVVMRLEVPRIVFETGREAIERFGRIAAFRFNDAQVAKGVGNTILLVNRFGVKFGRARIAAFVAKQSLFEEPEPGSELKNLRAGGREEVKLVHVLDCFCFATFADATITELVRLDGKF